MEQTDYLQSPVIQVSGQKIYKSNAIRIATFIGGPPVAGYLIAENFKAFNEPDKAKRTWIYTIAATILIFGVAFLIPPNNRSGDYLVPLIYTWIAYYLVQHYQGTNITDHVNAGGQFYNWGRTIGIAFIGLAVILVAIVAVVYVSDTVTSTETVKTYGASGDEVHFDSANLSGTESDKIGEAFIAVHFFGPGNKKSVYVKKVGSNYEISIACNKTVLTNPEIVPAFVQVRDLIQKQFPQNKIIFNLVVDSLDNVVKRIE